VGSRGSVIRIFQQQRKTGTITVTDPRMTRFWLTIDQGVRFVIRSVERMHGGEIFVPKIPSMNIMELIKVVAPGCEVDTIGIRPGEKLHEVLVSEDEARHSIELDHMYVVLPAHPWWSTDNWKGERPGDGFCYTSNGNNRWLDEQGLAELMG
jgi:FlaA1/EpsC-like NDP-sugar epimerase